MSLFDLTSLYKEVIMDHSKNPRHKKPIANYTHRVELLNPTCGDALVVEFTLHNDTIEEVGFTGQGCAISMASADMMCDTLKNKTKEQALEIIENFTHLIGGELKSQAKPLMDTTQLQDVLQDAYLLEGIKKFPARYKCGILAWRALELGMSQNAQTEEGIIERE